MYSGELEVQAKRKAIAVLQDEINRILNAGRVLSTLPQILVKKTLRESRTHLNKFQVLKKRLKILDGKLRGMYQMLVV